MYEYTCARACERMCLFCVTFRKDHITRTPAACGEKGEKSLGTEICCTSGGGGGSYGGDGGARRDKGREEKEKAEGRARMCVCVRARACAQY